jgi:hypothetical protein
MELFQVNDSLLGAGNYPLAEGEQVIHYTAPQLLEL